MAKQKTKTGNTSGDKSVFLILLELVYFIVLLVPSILSALVRKLWPPRCKSLDGLVVLVTGAGKGLGRELALGFAHYGATVACADADREAALETAEEIVRDGERAKVYHADVTSPEQIAKLNAAVAKDFGLVDILVIYHSSFSSQAVEDTSETAARTLVDDNFLSHVWMVREFLPRMKQRGSGHVVSVSSLAGHCGLAGAAVYAGTCWAVNGFMESVRMEILLEGYEDIQFTIVNAAVRDDSLSKSYSLNTMQTCSYMVPRMCFRQKLGTRSPDSVAVSTITGVMRNQVYVNVPEQIYLMCAMAKLLPTEVVDWAHTLLGLKPTQN